MTHAHDRAARPPSALLALAAALALASGADAARAGTTIDTRPQARVGVASFGETDTTSYGQTFRVPNAEDTRLDAVAFFLKPVEGVTRLRAYVYKWNEQRGSIEGPALYRSAVRELQPRLSFERVSFATRGVELAAGRDYAAFFSVAGLFDGQHDRADWLGVRGDAYSDGHFIYHNSNGRFPGPTTSWLCGRACDYLGSGGDLGFQMAFNTAPIPEPASAALMLAGAGLLGAVAWRRRQP